MIRILAITKEEIGVDITLRTDLMTAVFPSIWLEIKDKHRASSIISCFYRQWSNGGARSAEIQVK